MKRSTRKKCANSKKILVLQASGDETTNKIDLSEVGWEDSGLFLTSGVENRFGLMWTS
jgi:hypothetical protein